MLQEMLWEILWEMLWEMLHEGNLWEMAGGMMQCG